MYAVNFHFKGVLSYNKSLLWHLQYQSALIIFWPFRCIHFFNFCLLISLVKWEWFHTSAKLFFPLFFSIKDENALPLVHVNCLISSVCVPTDCRKRFEHNKHISSTTDHMKHYNNKKKKYHSISCLCIYIQNVF